MIEYLIEDLTTKEERILFNSDLDWYPDSFDSRDVCFESEEERDKALSLIGREITA